MIIETNLGHAELNEMALSNNTDIVKAQQNIKTTVANYWIQLDKIDVRCGPSAGTLVTPNVQKMASFIKFRSVLFLSWYLSS